MPPVTPTFQSAWSACVEKYADTIAWIDEEKAFTYTDFDGMIRRTAYAIHQHCVQHQSDSLVIYADRGRASTLAVLAACYLRIPFIPVDVSTPMARLEKIVQQLSKPLVLSDQELSGLCPSMLIQVCVNEKRALSPGISWSESKLAYVIFTSGSTGIPKGVPILWEHVAGLIKAWSSYVPVEMKRSSLFYPLSFDASINELFWPLLTGKTAVFIPSKLRTDPPALQAYCNQHAIDSVLIPPALLPVLPREGWSTLKLLVIGGDVADPDSMDYWSTQCVLLNCYGPTEATVMASVHHYQADDHPKTIGYPLSGQHVFCLDDDGNETSENTVGELVIAGRLMLGYLHEHDNIFSPDAALKPLGMYYTGDYGYRDEQGRLCYLKRKDQQKQRHGYRIECQEIISVALSHPKVTHAFSTVSKQDDLVLFYCATVSVETLKTFLLRHLPGYMIPNRWVLVADPWPMNASGKASETCLLRLLENESEPENDVGLKELLSVIQPLFPQHLQPNKTWIEQGADSLTLMKLQFAIEKKYKHRLEQKDLVKLVTPAGLAFKLKDKELSVQESQPSHALSSVVTIPQRQIIIQERLHGYPGLHHIPLLWQLDGPLNVGFLGLALKKVMHYHPVFYTRFDWRGDEIVQHIDHTLALPSLVLMEETSTSMNDQVEAFFHLPFNLQEGPHVRFALWSQSKESHVLACCMHHVLCDAWSVSMFLKQVSDAYRVIVKNEPWGLDVPHDLCDQAQEEIHNKDHYDEALVYWKNSLAGLPCQDLPTDCPRPTTVTGKAKTLSLHINKEFLLSLKMMAGSHQATLFPVLIGAFFLVQSACLNQEDCCVATVMANRRTLESASVMGVLANPVLLRQIVSENISWKEFLCQLRDHIKEVSEYQGVSVSDIAKSLQQPFRMDKQAFTSLMFVYQNTLDVESLQLEGVSATADLTFGFGALSDVAQYDICVQCFPTEEGMRIEWTYYSEIFSHERMTHMLTSYERVLRRAVQDPAQRVEQLLDDSATHLPACGEQLSPPVRHCHSWNQVPLQWQEVSELWGSLLNIPTNSPSLTQDFFDLGGDSLTAIRLLEGVERLISARVLMSDFLNDSTFSGLIAAVQGFPEGPRVPKEALKALKWKAVKNNTSHPGMKHAFLTGANGFVGIHFLYEHLNTHTGSIICLLRSPSDKQSLQEKAQQYALTIDWSRVTVLQGDLSRSQMGLSEDDYTPLLESVDSIIHVAAHVNHVLPYSALHADNVLGTQSLLELALTGHPKSFHFVSTLSAGTEYNKKDMIAPTCRSSVWPDEIGGYAQTKWVCERMIMQAFSQGLSGNIYRLGLVVGDSVDRQPDRSKNHLLCLLDSCVAWGVYPHWKTTFSLTPVSKVASMIVQLMRSCDQAIHHLADSNQITWKELIADYSDKELKAIDPSEWFNEYVLPADSSVPLYPLKSLYSAETPRSYVFETTLPKKPGFIH